jgi:bacillithiol system protein YtxJ
LIEHLDDARREEADYAVVTVQTHREVSNAVSARLGVRHETPQALLIRRMEAKRLGTPTGCNARFRIAVRLKA